MGNLRVDTITASDGSSPVTLTKQSAAKVWANYNGTGTPAVRDSFNLSSITDNGTGDNTVNLSNSMSNSNYSTSGSGNEQDNNTGFYVRMLSPINRASGTYRFFCSHTDGTKADFEYVAPQIYGDLA